jgi:hypothetical protein
MYSNVWTECEADLKQAKTVLADSMRTWNDEKAKLVELNAEITKANQANPRQGLQLLLCSHCSRLVACSSSP